MNLLKNILFIIVFSIIPINLLANDQWYINEISNEVEIDYERTCDSIVNVISQDTRKRLSPKNNYASIEQIYERETISISEKRVECKGKALLSNGIKQAISYGSYVDNIGDIIYFHSLD